jgi:lysophospholipase L1-like esterase
MVLMAALAVLAEEDSVDLSKLQKDFSQWKIQNAVKVGSKDGYIQMVLSGGQPMFFTPVISINADKVKNLTFKMILPDQIKLSGNILFITSADGTWSDDKNVDYECSSNGKVSDYKINMSKNKHWKGTVTQLRFTPVYVPNFGTWSDSKKYFEIGAGFTDVLPPYSWKWSQFGLQQTYNACSIPAEYPDTGTRKLEFSNMMKARNADAKIVFLGDSITNAWQYNPQCINGSEIWQEKYVPMSVHNCAISGDKTENVLWQLTEGNSLTGMHPSLFVILIGINNVMHHDSPSSIASGIKSIITVLQKNYPDAKILLFGILPTCFDWDKNNSIDADAQKVNQIIKDFADNKNITFMDMRKAFLKEDGAVDTSMFYDGLHLSEKGYATWDKTMMPVIQKLLSK